MECCLFKSNRSLLFDSSSYFISILLSSSSSSSSDEVESELEEDSKSLIPLSYLRMAFLKFYCLL
jgi:hypothetical protein